MDDREVSPGWTKGQTKTHTEETGQPCRAVGFRAGETNRGLIVGEPHEIDRAMCSLRLQQQHHVHARITRAGDSRPEWTSPIFSMSCLMSRSVWLQKKIYHRGKTIWSKIKSDRISFVNYSKNLRRGQLW